MYHNKMTLNHISNRYNKGEYNAVVNWLRNTASD